MNDQQTETLGGFIRRLMEERELNNSQLARKAGIAEGSIRNLLKVGSDLDAPAPSPLTLKAVAGYFELDPLVLYELAGYLDVADSVHIGAAGKYVGRRYEKLPQVEQRMLLDRLSELEQQAGLVPAKNEVVNYLNEAEILSRQRSEAARGLDQYIDEFVHPNAPVKMLDAIQRRLNRLFLPGGVTKDHVEAVLANPVGKEILSVLFPMLTVEDPLEKLFYITYFVEDNDELTGVETWIQRAWQLLIRATAARLASS